MTELDGKHALVTGGGSGAGAAIAQMLAGAGAKVTICGRRLDPLLEIAAKSAKISAVQADVTDEASIETLYGDATEKNGKFDIVIANAGMAESSPAHRTDTALWQKTLNVNLTGAFLTARPAIDALRKAKYGRLVFVASTAGLKGYPYVSAYCAAKHGVVGLARSLAMELASTNVTVNAVCPGFTETPLLAESVDRIMKATGRSEAEARASLAESNPQSRFIQPDEIASAVLWLCDPASQSITGQAISVSGGEV